MTATSLRIEHIESEDPGLVAPHWHVQRLLVGELDVSIARGITPGLGIALAIPLRQVRDRIRVEDLARTPYSPPIPDTHHRNETLVNVADPRVSAVIAEQHGAWGLRASVGSSIPIGRTESNPFALGRLGLLHQHIQFGTGTWDPLLTASALRSVGAFGLDATASVKFSLYENSQGFRAGNRYGATLGVGRKLGTAWGGSAGLVLDRESPEKWIGEVEEEGNLGRTDLMVTAGFGHSIAHVGSLSFRAQVPIKTWATGEQVEYPLIVTLGWAR
ncbi:MAG: hypothetical protein HOP12_13165 [Candidatus Eisenbacteria bacterium]|uniref:Transporter n=1 Tax=Eiseniibacteriota bacterium TaxID=2212470 RepID=A0A849SKY2_UNCEI|nr:hypothetical protein [Candidatus Eisenbacteria bacterium]